MPAPLVVTSLRVPRESENTPEQTAQLLASLSKAVKTPDLIGKLLKSQPIHLSLEVSVSEGQVVFAVVHPASLTSFVQSQFLATYPDVVMAPVTDYLQNWQTTLPAVALVKLQYAPYFPLRDYADYKEVDPMLPILGILSKASIEDKILVQFVLTTASKKVQKQAYSYLHPKSGTDSSGKPIKEPPPEGKKLIEDKLSQPLIGVSIRFAANRPEIISDLLGAISVLNRPDGNALVPGKLLPWQKSKLWDRIRYRLPFTSTLPPLNSSTLNVMELSSLWHLPGIYTKLPNISWAVSSSFSETPDNLPVYQKLSTEHLAPSTVDSNESTNFFAKSVYKNEEAIFGMKLEDRMRHFYILGKSGTGKSTLLENMAVDDFKKGRGVAFIDPHGDSAENLLNYIPKNRINDVVYFNPADREYPLAINILESKNPDQSELVTSGIVAIFHKLYGNSWGPRLEYILRNTVLTLTQVPGTTLPDVIRMLTDERFRKNIYPRVTNPQLLLFWQNEFDRLEEKTRLEHISPILNKVGQFVNSPLIHNIISHPKSTVSLEEILDSGKILIANLSQGKLGEDNATLLGAMFITKIQLAAMSRVDQAKHERKDFFLYVDEFQNFATESFIKILSEARKFRLGLILANQYMAQIPEEIQKAIFGNAGSMACFVLGSEDARIMEKEFGEKFTQNSLVSLQKHQIVLKMTIDGTISQPFLATTLPPLKSTNQNRDKVIQVSRERWTKKPKNPTSQNHTEQPITNNPQLTSNNQQPANDNHTPPTLEEPKI